MRDRKTDSIIPQSSDAIRPEHPRYRMTEEQKKKNELKNEITNSTHSDNIASTLDLLHDYK